MTEMERLAVALEKVAEKSKERKTELWALAIWGIIVVANGTEYVNIPTEQMLAYTGAVATYIGGRTAKKIFGKDK